ncbi:hypothetical protein EUX98_g7252 [Antrodiella citrinella]|uniref:ATP-dependent DNA helicase n=1 Tax=Antrodiella citrinella TaxID=2447956 RepID=A0A4S4MMK2_9APHY|nr:hypothetical protein EUX98_g7252 [Antrodiella citrinella]
MTADRETRFVLSGAEYYHECALAANEDNRHVSEHIAMDLRGEQDTCNDDDITPEGPDLEDEVVPIFTDEGLQALQRNLKTKHSDLFGLTAVQAGQHAKVFPTSHISWPVEQSLDARRGTEQDKHNLHVWREQMKHNVAVLNIQPHTHERADEVQPSTSRMTMSDTDDRIDDSGTVSYVAPEAPLLSVDPSCLRDDQFRAYNIILWHLEQTLAGKVPPPLRMIIYGEGGTGKSKVIQTATDAFKAKGVSYLLVKAAYTGIAASLIDGKTTHVIGRISVGRHGELTMEARAKLQRLWHDAKYLVVDEFSMISKSFLAQLSAHIAIGKEGCGDATDDSFGGVNVVLVGDLHQFPPVAKGPAEALFRATSTGVENPILMQGRAIYEEFKVVVILKEQVRVIDTTWLDFLHKLRDGTLKTTTDLEVVHTLALDDARCSFTDFTASPWMDACLITSRHCVRVQWNAAAVHALCERTRQRMYCIDAEDRMKGMPLNLEEKYALVARARTEHDRSKKDLPESVDIVKGMKVMVTTNLETDLDMANGARGTVFDIILHPQEPEKGEESIAPLHHLPLCILIKMDRTR